MSAERSKSLISREINEYSKVQYLYDILSEYAAKYLFWKVMDHFKDAKWPVLHTKQHRAKSITSLSKRLSENKLSDFKDLAGSRIIFHFKDDMDSLYENKSLIKSWFGIQAKDSLHKKIDPLSEEFGYDSYHFNYTVIDGNDFYKSLKERDQERLNGLHGEMQIRTILQHAWAESEHELIYKRNEDYEFSPTERKEQIRKWAMHAANIESLDFQFIERKGYFKYPGHTSDESSLIAKKKPPCTKGVNVWGKVHPYIFLHKGDPADIVINPSWEMYNVNKYFGYDYKSIVWNEMLINNRQFIDSLQSYDTPLARLSQFDKKNRIMDVQPAVYTDQLVTNHPISHDIMIPRYKKTVKELNETKKGLKSLKTSRFSNTIGVSCVMRTSDNRWVISKRKNKLAIDSEAIACPASGAIEWRERESWDKWNMMDWIGKSILIECEQELGVSIDSENLTYLGLYRELYRLGKPQVFFLIDMFKSSTGLSTEIIDSSWHIYSKDQEFEDVRFLTTDDMKILINENLNNVTNELLMNTCLAFSTLGIK